MGKVYKRKRRSCAMCKPHKVGWEPKRKDKERELCREHEQEMREARQRDA